MSKSNIEPPTAATIAFKARCNAERKERLAAVGNPEAPAKQTMDDGWGHAFKTVRQDSKADTEDKDQDQDQGAQSGWGKAFADVAK